MSELDAHGVAVEVPKGWDGRVFRRSEQGEPRASEVPGEAAPPGERTFPLLQLATVAVPPDAADYGSDVVDELGADDVLIVLKEFDPALATSALFQKAGMPHSLTAQSFDTATLQRSLVGQGGHQSFFNDGNRAFSLYIVLGDFTRRASAVPAINEILASVRIEPGDPVPPPQSRASEAPEPGSPEATEGEPGPLGLPAGDPS